MHQIMASKLVLQNLFSGWIVGLFSFFGSLAHLNSSSRMLLAPSFVNDCAEWYITLLVVCFCITDWSFLCQMSV